MKPLKELSDNAVIETWVRSATYAQAVSMLGVYGFAATPDSLRRRVRAILHKRSELPLGRTPTVKDYQRIKVQYFSGWQDAEIL